MKLKTSIVLLSLISIALLNSKIMAQAFSPKDVILQASLGGPNMLEELHFHLG